MEFQDADGYGVRIVLYIDELEEDDFGYYKCEAVNALGRPNQFVELIGKIIGKKSIQSEFNIRL